MVVDKNADRENVMGGGKIFPTLKSIIAGVSCRSTPHKLVCKVPFVSAAPAIRGPTSRDWGGSGARRNCKGYSPYVRRRGDSPMDRPEVPLPFPTNVVCSGKVGGPRDEIT